MNSQTPEEIAALEAQGGPFAVEVIADNSGKWCGNGKRYATTAEALAAADDLSYRWTAVRSYRIIVAPDKPS